MPQRIDALAEELEDLRTEKNRILASFDLTDDKDMAEIRKWTKHQEAAIQTLNAQQDRCELELNHAAKNAKHYPPMQPTLTRTPSGRND